MYNIRKGWPCDGALDETLVPAAPKTITNGMLAAINTSGKLEKANLTAAAGRSGSHDRHCYRCGQDERQMYPAHE